MASHKAVTDVANEHVSAHSAPPTPLSHDPRLERPSIVGGDEPAAPYPIYARGEVMRGFGRGSKELGCPTGPLASLPLDRSFAELVADSQSPGRGDSAARVDVTDGRALWLCQGGLLDGGRDDQGDARPPFTYGHVCALRARRLVFFHCNLLAGWLESLLQEREENSRAEGVGEAPMSNSRGAQEVHILHDFPADFYGHQMSIIVLGFIRPEYNYTSLGALPVLAFPFRLD
jgi:riboflavin kinase